jgi:PAS domain S-box-containing protein
MEDRIFEELGKAKANIRRIYTDKFSGKLTAQEIEFIIDSFDAIIFEMVKLMKKGKTVHETFFSNIILRSPDAIMGFYNESEIFVWNEGAEKLFGWKKEEVIGKDFEILIPEYLKAKGEKEYIIREAKEKGFISNYETQRITKSGELKDVSITRFPILDDKKETIGNVGIIRDLTTQKNLERELKEKEKLAIIGEVVSTIAHNLSNPLNIISGNADYLLMDKTERAEGYEELKVIIAETTRITKSIRQILNFSKPVNLTKEKTNINNLINEVTERVRFIINDKKINFESDFKTDINEIPIDREQMQDVLLNILNNSIQAIHSEGYIKIKTNVENGKLKIIISDNGGGIKESDLHNIFKPFFSTKEYGKGTGLGLSFAERVIKEHRGTIKAESEYRKGTTFTILLPISTD